MLINSYIITINIISFIIYYIDKRKSIKNKYRIRENILIGLSLIGGCFGSLLSMSLFHHKTNHLKFKLIVPLLCIIWLLIILKIKKAI